MKIQIKIKKATAKLSGGRIVRIPGWVLDSGAPGPHLFLVAGQHGMEVNGIDAARRFVEIAKTKLARGKLTVVPFADLPALRLGFHHMGIPAGLTGPEAESWNMNRTWPGKPDGNDEERISYAIYKTFGKPTTHVLDLHSWSSQYAPAAVVGDHPDFRKLAGSVGARFVNVMPLTNVGTLVGFFRRSGRLGLTYECSGQNLAKENQIRQCLEIIQNTAKVVGIFKGVPKKLNGSVLFSDQARDIELKAPCSGIFIGEKLEFGAPIAKKQKLGHILSDTDLRRWDIVAPVKGYLRSLGTYWADRGSELRRHHPLVAKGDLIATITCPK